MKHSFSFHSKLPSTGISIFTVMSTMAQQHGAINLSQGFPDFSPDPDLLASLQQASLKGHHQYAPMAGLPRLRQLISDRVQARDGRFYDPATEITITSGATEALFCAAQMLVHPGDEVILFAPAYDCYEPGIRLAGGIARFIPLGYPHYRIDWQRVRESITNKTKGIYLNSPHNPTGMVIDSEDLQALTALVEEHGLWVVSDEVYDGMVFGASQRHLSLASVEALASRTLVISSFGKTLHTTGWKVGYCLAPSAWSEEFRKIHQWVTFAVATPFQHAIANYLTEHADRVAGLSTFYQQKRDLFLRLTAPSSFVPIPSQGTYFQLMEYAAIKEVDDVTFSKWLTTEIGVACIPISIFYPDGEDRRVVRFCFAKQDDTLEQAAARLVHL